MRKMYCVSVYYKSDEGRHPIIKLFNDKANASRFYLSKCHEFEDLGLEILEAKHKPNSEGFVESGIEYVDSDDNRYVVVIVSLEAEDSDDAEEPKPKHRAYDVTVRYSYTDHLTVTARNEYEARESAIKSSSSETIPLSSAEVELIEVDEME